MLTIIIALFGFVLCFWYFLYEHVKVWNKNRLKIKSIPGVPAEEMIFNGWLFRIIGNLDALLGAPDEIFRRTRQFATFGTTVILWFGFLPCAYTTSPENIEKIISLMNHVNRGFVYDPFYEWLRTGVFTSSGSKWQNRRKLLSHSFDFKILKSFLPIFIKQTKNLVKELEPECKKESTNVIPFMKRFALKTICETAMGITLNFDETDNHYIKAVEEMTSFVVYRLSRPWLLPWFTFMFTSAFWKQKAASKITHGFSAKVIAQRKKTFNPSDYEKTERDLSTTKDKLAMLDMLLYAQQQGAAIDDDGIQEEVDTFMFGGHDTTAMSVNFTMMLLACNKECQDKLYEELCSVFGDSDRDPTYQDLKELKYLERCVKESLRLYPSTPIINRDLDEDIITHEGYYLPKGMPVGIGIFDTHHSPLNYPDPEKFDPDRFLPENIAKRHPYAYIPFSAGPRNCIGLKYALLELKTVVAGVLRNYILEPVDTPESCILIADAILRTKYSKIEVRFKQRK